MKYGIGDVVHIKTIGATGPITDILPNGDGVYRVVFQDDATYWRRYWALASELSIAAIAQDYRQR